jgi:hypothetical protein
MIAFWIALCAWANGLWVIGRRSEVAYVRFYPNPGVMFPWTGRRRVVWSRSDGWFVRFAGSHARPKYNQNVRRG